MNVITDAFKYFAKFPAKAGVMENFNKSESPYFDNYTTLKSEIDALDPHSQVPEIGDYVFGVDEESVKKRIEQINGIYLFVDYGNITTRREEPALVETADFLLAITVAMPMKPEQLDAFESVLISEQTLQHIVTIKNTMKEDSKNKTFTHQLTFPAEITPWYAREMANSHGWTMVFSKTGVQLV